MIELKHITKVFPTADGELTALNDVNITIHDGDVYGIVGMSGAGKSTLVRCINLLERPTSGQVVIDGKDLCVMPAKELIQQRRSISMIFQQFNLLMQRTCLKNICFPMEIAGVKAADAQKKAKELEDLQRRSQEFQQMAQRDYAKKQEELLQPIIEKAKAAIDKIAAAGGYLFVFDTSAGSLAYFDEAALTDLAPEVRKELGITDAPAAAPAAPADASK